jgi:crotonobetainyl-CoA:carnitine CoA-transferase CaiB-like acyl-CoA transferase
VFAAGALSTTGTRSEERKVQALNGIRVLDAATNIAGPYGASLLSDLGADVIKVEPLRGDPMRAYPPAVDGTTTQFAAVNHDKDYVALDLRSPGGRDVLHRLCREADVLVQNMRPGHEAKLGLDAASCHAANPRLVHATVAAFHPADGDRPGYDMLVQGESGLLDQTGEPDRPPSRIGASAIDYVSALWLTIGILGALQGEREREAIRVSMLDAAIGLLNEKVSAFVATGEAPRRMGAGTSVTTPHGAFETADSGIVIGAATDEAFQRLAGTLGPPLDGDERFATQSGRLAHRAEVEGLVTELLGARGADHWIEVLAAAGVAVGRVSPLAEAVARHREASRTGMRAVDGLAGVEVLAPAIAFAHHDWPALARPGAPGRDTDAVLVGLGYDPAEIDALRAAGAIA